MMFYQLIKFLFEQVSTKERFRDINMVTSYIMTTGHIFIFVGTFIIKVCLCYSLWKWLPYILIFYLHRRTQIIQQIFEIFRDDHDQLMIIKLIIFFSKGTFHVGFCFVFYTFFCTYILNMVFSGILYISSKSV